jgi:hypothetical protein
MLEELNLAVAALSILSDQVTVLAGTDQHEAFLSVADLCKEEVQHAEGPKRTA